MQLENISIRVDNTGLDTARVGENGIDGIGLAILETLQP